MSRLKNLLHRGTKLPGMPKARHITERAVAPYLRADLHSLHLDLISLAERLTALEDANRALSTAVADIETHMPPVLNAIASTNGTARILRRDFDRLHTDVAGLEVNTQQAASELRTALGELDAAWRTEIAGTRVAAAEAVEGLRQALLPHIDMIGWLLRRVEMVRAEVMNELRYGPEPGAAVEPRILNEGALVHAEKELRLNLGAGHLPLDGYVNVDIRELPGIDVVAPVDKLPFDAESVSEIFSAHTLEHFPIERLRRTLLPYWFNLLKPGGTFRAVVPDLEAMSTAYATGHMTFETVRSVTYGGQEYEGDFHFTGFTPASLAELLTEAGLVDARVIAAARPNGDCLECEVSAIRPVR